MTELKRYATAAAIAAILSGCGAQTAPKMPKLGYSDTVHVVLYETDTSSSEENAAEDQDIYSEECAAYGGQAVFDVTDYDAGMVYYSVICEKIR